MATEVWALAAHDQEAAAAVRAFYDQYATHVAALLRDRVPGLPAATARHRAEVLVMLMEGAALFRSGVGRRSTWTDTHLRHVLLTLLTEGGRSLS